MKEPMIADLTRSENQVVTGYFVAASRQLRTKADGSSYLALTFADRSGQIEARLWDADTAEEFAQGDVVKARAEVCRYQEKLQLKVQQVRRARPDEYDLADFVPATGRNIDELWAELNAWVATFTDADLAALLRAFLEDAEISAALKQAPAAKSMHHAFLGGLLEHVVSLVGISDLAARHYPAINRDLLLTGAMLHDIGKLQELRWGTTFDYTMEGQLLGHITLGIGMVERKLASMPAFPPSKRLLVEHMILSHHGRYEFGSPKLPMLPEAILLHYLDDMDAKMQTIRGEFTRAAANGRPAGQMTDWVRSMERPLLDTQAFLEAAQPPVREAGEQEQGSEEPGLSVVESEVIVALPSED